MASGFDAGGSTHRSLLHNSEDRDLPILERPSPDSRPHLERQDPRALVYYGDLVDEGSQSYSREGAPKVQSPRPYIHGHRILTSYAIPVAI